MRLAGQNYRLMSLRLAEVSIGISVALILTIVWPEKELAAGSSECGGLKDRPELTQSHSIAALSMQSGGSQRDHKSA